MEPFGERCRAKQLGIEAPIAASERQRSHARSPENLAGAQLDPIGRRICKLLRIHTQIEEALFYPAARSALRDTRLVDRVEAEHTATKQAIRDVEARTSDAGDYIDAVQRLRGLIEPHIREEESEQFPRLRKTELNLDMLALLDRRNTLMDVMGLHPDDGNTATRAPPRLGGNTDAGSASLPDPSEEASLCRAVGQVTNLTSTCQPLPSGCVVAPERLMTKSGCCRGLCYPVARPRSALRRCGSSQWGDRIWTR